MSKHQNQGLPRRFNSAFYFIDRHLIEGRGHYTAVIDGANRYTYQQLADQVNQTGNALRILGMPQESRIALCLDNSFEYACIFWGCIKSGLIPVNFNNGLVTEQFDYMLNDCRARILIVDEQFYQKFAPILAKQNHLEHIIVVGDEGHGHNTYKELIEGHSLELDCAHTTGDDVALWLYSSGTTGHPKGVIHVHSSLFHVANGMGRQILNINEQDIIFTVPKLFFAYGLGNGMLFPFSVGAATIMMRGRPTAEAALNILKEHQPTLFGGVPTLFASMLATIDDADMTEKTSLRRCLSAGEALPEDLGRRWEKCFNAPLLSGVGMTEMLHNFICNPPDKVRYDASGLPVPGYTFRLVGEDDQDVPLGEIGEMWVSGPTQALGYWNQREKDLNTFIGRWMKTGDKYYKDDQGYFHYQGRADDMFKSGGNWVSPAEIEATLSKHHKVLEAAVVPRKDKAGNEKPCAYVTLKPGQPANQDLVPELQQFVKDNLELWKYPRWIELRDDLPKTATGKIQRHKLREELNKTTEQAVA